MRTLQRQSSILQPLPQELLYRYISKPSLNRSDPLLLQLLPWVLHTLLAPVHPDVCIHQQVIHKTKAGHRIFHFSITTTVSSFVLG